MTSVVAPPALRAEPSELALVGAYLRDPGWLERWQIPSAWLMGHASRTLYAALLELIDQGEDLTREGVAAAAGIAPGIFEADDVVATAPDVPRLVRRLHALHALRRLRLLALTAAHRAEQPEADPVVIGEALRELLDEAVAPCPLPRRPEAMRQAEGWR